MVYLVDSFNLSCRKGGEKIKVVVEKERICQKGGQYFPKSREKDNRALVSEEDGLRINKEGLNE